MRRILRGAAIGRLTLACLLSIPALAFGSPAIISMASAASTPSPTSHAMPMQASVSGTAVRGDETTGYATVGAGAGGITGQETVGTATTRLVTSYHVPVLMYHRIAPASERGSSLANLIVSPTAFNAQLRALKAAGWHTITSAQLADAMAAKRAVPAKTFVITLDDGRLDGYTHAFPILRRYGFVATFFVITGRVGHSQDLTWAALREMQAAGMEIGNHTVSHVSEATFSRARTDAQVMGAQRAIASHLGVTPVSFAYPFGAHPANLVASVRASGLKIAYTTVFGARETLGTRFLLPRVRIHPTTTASGIVGLLSPYR